MKCNSDSFAQGKKARLEVAKDDGSVVVADPPSYRHDVSDYINCGLKNGFNLVDIEEWFDEDKTDMPRIITFTFQKRRPHAV